MLIHTEIPLIFSSNTGFSLVKFSFYRHRERFEIPNNLMILIGIPKFLFKKIAISVVPQIHMCPLEIKDYNVMIDGQNFFDQQVANNFRTYDIIRKTVTSQGDDHTTSCL